MTPTLTKRYFFHGLRLETVAAPLISDALHARLQRFEAEEEGPTDVRFEFAVRCPPFRVLPAHGHAEAWTTSRVIYEFGKCAVRYEDRTDTLILDSPGRLEARCDLRAGSALVCLSPLDSRNLYLTAHPVFTIALMELLKARGLYSLHAAGLCRGPYGLLLVGPSGSGKSTLALALARAGFGFLGDDLLFLSRNTDGLRAHAFPDTIGLTEGTERFFPGLEDMRRLPLPEGWPKRQIPSATIVNAAPAWQCRPSVIVFPTVAHAETSVLQPMTPDEALLELTPNVLLTDAARAQAHLDMLAQLARECPCYRLLTGHDFGPLAARLDELLKTAERGCPSRSGRERYWAHELTGAVGTFGCAAAGTVALRANTP
jgi:hypothetical protein